MCTADWTSSRYQYLISSQCELWTYQLHISSFNSSKDTNLDSQNTISIQKFNALSNGELAVNFKQCLIPIFYFFTRDLIF